MPRRPRLKSQTGVYHAMLRGVNKQNIFEDEQDKHVFLNMLKKGSTNDAGKVYGYCLMNNHVHLLMGEDHATISKIIQRISSSYASYFNQKYERVGHLFQNRFRSEVVESDGEFLHVLRYIHQNPLNAHLVKRVYDSKWTSYREYIGSVPNNLIHRELAFRLFLQGNNEEKIQHELNNPQGLIAKFVNFTSKVNNDQYLENTYVAKNTDAEVISKLKAYGLKNVSALQQLERSERNQILCALKNTKGVSVRQIARVTGISRSVIDRL
jgi:putative transposase